MESACGRGRSRGDFDADAITSNVFEMQWPPGSGEMRTFPEVDRAAWFSVADARIKLLSGQRPLLDRLEDLLAGADAGDLPTRSEEDASP